MDQTDDADKVGDQIESEKMAPETNEDSGQSPVAEGSEVTPNKTDKGQASGEICNSDIVGVLKRLEQKIDTIDQTTKDMRSSFDRRLGDLEDKVAGNTKKVDDLEASVNYAHKGIEDYKDTVAKLQRDNKELREKLNSTQRSSKIQSTNLEDYKQETLKQMNDIERRSRAYSIRIKGVPAAAVAASGGDHRKVVADILVKNKVVAVAPDESDGIADAVSMMEIAHPLGPPRGGKQNMIARFYARPYRDSVVRAAKGKYNLVGAERIQEDLTKMDLDLKTKAYPQMKQAHEAGKRVRFNKGKLYINGTETPV